MLGYMTAVSDQKVEHVSTSVAILDASCSKNSSSSNTGVLIEMNRKCCTFATAPLMVFIQDVSPKVTILSGGTCLPNDMQEKPRMYAQHAFRLQRLAIILDLKLWEKLRWCGG